MSTPEEMLEEVVDATGLAVRYGGIELSKGESDFIDSVQETLDDGDELSDKQLASLTELWGKVAV